ncbi:MAG: type II toxin-antitoxin system VapC family toxin [Sulfurovum sp.]|nr:type II toxin-antitoxin system VapC family toxin [Sulfurovum sp.]
MDEVFEEDKSYYISLITYMEILSYNFTSKNEEGFIKNLLSLFEVIDISKEIAQNVILLKKMRKIKLPDAIIVATALTFDYTLLSNDKQLSTIIKIRRVLFSTHHHFA